MSCLPFVGVISLPLSGLGLILGVGGATFCMMRKGSGFGMTIAGTSVSAVALVFGIVWLTLIAGAGYNHLMNAPSVPITDGLEKETTPTQPAPAPPPASTPDWVDASQGTIQRGDVNVSVGPVRVEEVPLTDLGRSTSSKDKLLQITVHLRNTSATRKIDYESWYDTSEIIDRHIPSLSDNFDNHYKRISFGFGTEVVGHQQQASIHPGWTYTDLVIFEPPLANVTYVELALPASAFGGDGEDLKFRIPAAMIERTRPSAHHFPIGWPKGQRP